MFHMVPIIYSKNSKCNHRYKKSIPEVNPEEKAITSLPLLTMQPLP